MRYANRSWKSVLGTAALFLGVCCGPSLGFAAVQPADTPPTDLVKGEWQHRQATFDYVGFTTLYTCTGLEDKVRQILLHLGARRDAHVSAVGCPGPSNAPSRTAWVKADFYTLVPAPAASAGGPDTASARWAPLKVTPRRPEFMGDGDCELMQGMKGFITKNFTLRDIDYRTSCFPNTLSIDGFAVTGQALMPVPANSNAVTVRPITGRPVRS